MVYLGEAKTGFGNLKLQDTQDKMLRRGEKEFPSLESENVRASRDLGDQLASSPWVTDGRLRPRVRRETAGHRAHLGRAETRTQAEVQTSSENIPNSLDSLYSREKDLFLGGCSNLEKYNFSLPQLTQQSS